MGKVLLRVENISKAYKNRRGSKTVLDDLSLQIEAGRLYAVVGESGSGKTTLLSIMAGLQKPDSGNVIYQTEAGAKEILISELRDDQLSILRRHDIVYVPQSQDVLPTLNVKDNIRLVDNFDDQAKGEDELSRIGRLSLLLEELGISDIGEEYPSQLSGGELRRVCIARTLYAQPKLILADEPTNDLDKDNRDILRGIFRDIADKGIAVVIVTHDKELADSADEIIALS